MIHYELEFGLKRVIENETGKDPTFKPITEVTRREARVRYGALKKWDVVPRKCDHASSDANNDHSAQSNHANQRS